MVSFTSVAVAALAAVGVVAAPAASTTDLISVGLAKRQNTPNSEGWHDGYYYSWWSDGASPAQYYNLAGGTYTVQWQPGGNIVGGKGWNPGTNNRVVQYSGTYNYQGNSYLCLYGWMRNPLVEYYVVDNFGDYDPSYNADRIGEVYCDGSTYRLATSWRVNQPSIDGTQTFQQYWSVRNDKRTGGTIDAGCHFQAWANAGLALGNHYYQILATEGFQSSGNSEITVWE